MWSESRSHNAEIFGLKGGPIVDRFVVWQEDAFSGLRGSPVLVFNLCFFYCLVFQVEFSCCLSTHAAPSQSPCRPYSNHGNRTDGSNSMLYNYNYSSNHREETDPSPCYCSYANNHGDRQIPVHASIAMVVTMVTKRLLLQWAFLGRTAVSVPLCRRPLSSMASLLVLHCFVDTCLMCVY